MSKTNTQGIGRCCLCHRAPVDVYLRPVGLPGGISALRMVCGDCREDAAAPAAPAPVPEPPAPPPEPEPEPVDEEDAEDLDGLLEEPD